MPRRANPSPPAVPLSPASRHIWRYLTEHPGEWTEAKALVTDNASFRTVARLLKLMVAVGLVEVRPTFPAWEYRHTDGMRAADPETARTLDSLL
jgi:hypothetical protein